MVKITQYDSIYDESSPDIPSGYGIEQHPRDGWYAYRLPEYVGLVQIYLKDEQGLDRIFSSREDALAAIKAEQASVVSEEYFQHEF